MALLVLQSPSLRVAKEVRKQLRKELQSGASHQDVLKARKILQWRVWIKDAGDFAGDEMLWYHMCHMLSHYATVEVSCESYIGPLLS